LKIYEFIIAYERVFHFSYLILGNWSENNSRNTLERPPPPPISSASQHAVGNLHHMAGKYN